MLTTLKYGASAITPDFKRANASRICLNSFRISSSSSTFVAMPMTPRTRTCSYLERLVSHVAIFRQSSMEKPYFDSSCATCNSSNTSVVLPILALSASMTDNNFSLSTLCIIATCGRIMRTLFVCKCPIKCHSISAGNAEAFLTNSCALLSPKTLCPARYASKMTSSEWNFDTATNTTPAGSEQRISAIFSRHQSFLRPFGISKIFLVNIHYQGFCD